MSHEPGKTILHLLYEQSDTTQYVMDPDRFVYRRIEVANSMVVETEAVREGSSSGNDVDVETGAVHEQYV